MWNPSKTISNCHGFLWNIRHMSTLWHRYAHYPPDNGRVLFTRPIKILTHTTTSTVDLWDRPGPSVAFSLVLVCSIRADWEQPYYYYTISHTANMNFVLAWRVFSSHLCSTSLLVVVQRCPAVPTHANTAARTTMSTSALSSTRIALLPPSSRMVLPKRFWTSTPTVRPTYPRKK